MFSNLQIGSVPYVSQSDLRMMSNDVTGSIIAHSLLRKGSVISSILVNLLHLPALNNERLNYSTSYDHSPPQSTMLTSLFTSSAPEVLRRPPGRRHAVLGRMWWNVTRKTDGFTDVRKTEI